MKWGPNLLFRLLLHCMEIVLDQLGATLLRGHYSPKKWMNYLTKIITVCLFSVKRVDRTVTCIVNDSYYKSMLIVIRGQNVTLILETVPVEQ